MAAIFDEVRTLADLQQFVSEGRQHLLRGIRIEMLRTNLDQTTLHLREEPDAIDCVLPARKIKVSISDEIDRRASGNRANPQKSVLREQLQLVWEVSNRNFDVALLGCLCH